MPSKPLSDTDLKNLRNTVIAVVLKKLVDLGKLTEEQALSKLQELTGEPL